MINWKKINSYYFIMLCILCFVVLIYPIFKEIHINEISFSVRDWLQYSFFFDYHSVTQKNSISISNDALNNIYTICNGDLEFPPIKKNIKELWLNSNVYKNNSHEFYSHSLTIIWHLLLAHSNTNDSQYLEKGKEIIQSWIQNNSRFNPKSMEYAWNDHSTAKRTIVVLFFRDYINQFLSDDDNFNELLDLYLTDAVFYLKNSNNYSFPHNHGIYQDIALYFAALHMDEDKYASRYKEIAIKRFSKQIKNGFSPQGIHLENSPGYHFLTLQKSDEFITLANGDTLLSREITSIIDNAKKNIPLLLISNGNISPIGDTEIVEFEDDLYKDNPSFLADSLAGYVFLKSDNSTLQLRSTGLSATHKHHDAFSFLYSDSGNLIFTETGFLNFTLSDDRNYTISIQAHNSLLPNSQLGDYQKDYLTKITSYVNTSVIFMCTLDSESEERIERRFIKNKVDGSLFIIDEIQNTHQQEWLRLFHINNILKLTQINENCIEIKANNQDYYLQSYANQIEVVKGLNSPKIGWSSVNTHDLVSSAVVIERTNLEINIVSLSTETPIENLNFADDCLKYNHQKEYSIEFNNSALSFDGNTAKIIYYQNTVVSPVKRKFSIYYSRRLQLISLYVLSLVCLFLISSALLKNENKKSKIWYFILMFTFFMLSILSFLYLILNYCY